MARTNRLTTLTRKRLSAHLEDIYDLYEVELFACALSVTRCRELAADAVHDAFCSLLAINTRPDDLKSYTFRAVHNAALQLIRKKRPLNGLLNEPFLDRAPDIEELVTKAEDRARLNRALEKLSDPHREVILLHLYSGLTFREISEMRNDSINTVASWYRRGLLELRGRLVPEQESK